MFFSIVIPVFNREHEVLRAVMSCLCQAGDDVEVVVVDDGSQDGTVAALAQVEDSRFRLVRHAQNRGVCPARNTGIDHSSGEWILLLDSDDELLPDALACLRHFAEICPDSIERLGFLYRRDDGRMSPEPLPEDCVLDYPSYLQWVAGLASDATDFFHCTRRRSFQQVRFPNNRAFENPYLMDFAKAFRTRMLPEVVALVHMSSVNRHANTSAGTKAAAYLRNASDMADEWKGILDRHGAALKQYSPQRYVIYRKAEVLFHFMAGRRNDGWQLAKVFLWEYPCSLEGWVITVAGLAGPSVLAWVKAWKERVATK